MVQQSLYAFKHIPAWFIVAVVTIGGPAFAEDFFIVVRPDIREIAIKYVRENLPNDARVLEYKSIVIDEGEEWVVTFSPPGQAITGGVPEIAIDKKSQKVIGVTRAQ